MESNTFGRFFKNPQNIIALAVSLISISALIVSIKQTQIMSEQRVLMYEQAKASVWPRLEISVSKGHKLEDYSISQFSFIIDNGGVGPAIVTDIRVAFNDEVVSRWGGLFSKFSLPKETPLFYSNAELNNSIIKIGDQFPFLQLTDNLPVAQGFFDNREKISIEIWYESIYKDKWKLTYKNGKLSTKEELPGFSLEEKERFQD